MMIDRRTFLAGVPLVFGLDRLFAQDAAPRPAWLAAALRRMKSTGRFGIVFIVPDADPLQKQVGKALWSLAASELHPVRRILSETVPICVKPAQAATISTTIGDRTLLLLDPDGALLDGAPLEPADLEDGVRFTAAVDALLDPRRAARAAAIERGLTADVRGALQRLDAEEVDVRETAFATVCAKTDTIAPLLALLARAGATPELRGRAGQALVRFWERSNQTAFGPRLPYGTRVPRMKTVGCGAYQEAVEGEVDDGRGAAIRCGKAAVSAEESRLFLRFLAI